MLGGWEIFFSQLHAAGPKTFQQIEVSHWNIALLYAFMAIFVVQPV